MELKLRSIIMIIVITYGNSCKYHGGPQIEELK